MTRKISTLIAAFTLTITSVFAQTSDDNITFLKVQNQITNGNYAQALENLSSISSQGKNSSFYLTYSATCYEKTYRFDEASKFYKKLYTQTNSFDAMKKVAEMDEYQENKQKFLQVDSLCKTKCTEERLYKFRFTEGGEKLVIICKIAEGGFTVLILNLPTFKFNSLTGCNGKLEKNTNSGVYEYSFSGKYQTRWGGEDAACNKDVPESSFFGTLNSSFTKMTLLVFGYNCIKNSDGTFSVIKKYEGKPDYWELEKVSDFNLR